MPVRIQHLCWGKARGNCWDSMARTGLSKICPISSRGPPVPVGGCTFRAESTWAMVSWTYSSREPAPAGWWNSKHRSRHPGNSITCRYGARQAHWMLPGFKPCGNHWSMQSLARPATTASCFTSFTLIGLAKSWQRRLKRGAVRIWGCAFLLRISLPLPAASMRRRPTGIFPIPQLLR